MANGFITPKKHILFEQGKSFHFVHCTYFECTYVVHSTIVVGGLAYYVLQCTYWTFNSQYKTSKSFVVRACEKKNMRESSSFQSCFSAPTVVKTL